MTHMKSNYTILQRNTLDGLSETAGCLYMMLCDAFEAHSSPANECKAFFAACAYEDKVGGPLDYILRHYTGFDMSQDVFESLSEFFASRWRHNFADRQETRP